MGQRDEEEDEEWGEEEQEDLHTVLTVMMAVVTMMMVAMKSYSTCRQSTPLMRSPTAMPRAAATAGRMKTWQKIFL